MGVLNITPDSFSDGGSYYRNGQPHLDAVLPQAEQMLAAGAKILDVGGESTRPGAAAVSADEELSRVVPVVEALTAHFDVIVSVDTSTPAVMRDSAAVGAGMINDVRALRREGALAAAHAAGLPVCLMHMQGVPSTMQLQPAYQDVTSAVLGFLRDRVAVCVETGIPAEKLLIDPGFGFGKTAAHNLQLLKDLPQFAALGFPVVVGLSRKSMIDHLLGGRPVAQRLAGSIALALLAAQRGANILRCHDVSETVDALALDAMVRETDNQ
jgi:dihydropteroate synthase